jgi:hypothetical protein
MGPMRATPRTELIQGVGPERPAPGPTVTWHVPVRLFGERRPRLFQGSFLSVVGQHELAQLFLQGFVRADLIPNFLADQLLVSASDFSQDCLDAFG